MPLPIISNTVRAAIRGQTSSLTPFVNVMHFRKTSGAIDATAIGNLNTLINQLYGGPAFGAGVFLLNICNSTTLLLDGTYTPLDGTTASSVFAMTAAGTGVVESLPPEVAEVVTFRSTQRGRSFRGRVYLPPATENNTAGQGQIASTVLAGFVAQFNGFAAALTPVNWEHVIASYKLASAIKVSTYTMSNQFDVQRRRKPSH